MVLPHPHDQPCDCPCLVHRRSPRTDYTIKGCTCLLTCSTQPLTLLVKEWRCALFLHPGNGQLWFVMSTAHGKWDWESANEIDDRADVFETSQEVGALLHRIQALLVSADELGSV